MAIDPDDLKEEVENLSLEEFREFREWFAEYDDQVWQEQFEDDVEAGKLDDLASEAISEHENDQTTEL